ncbi:type II toxin-antitoxin system PemK/MazF family toxin [Arthrobacter sp. JZ12]|uniref:type II toxin-antitoxin system PemK/MazF family toxin n=1 Tax=Arthrobacter sp. JZ12 TaxID=2654190 RepID=UPI002B496232|nr:type II toxin-antitoxin system PemK/MazF family toxin [Arthrobacter sp. JZ12]
MPSLGRSLVRIAAAALKSLRTRPVQPQPERRLHERPGVSTRPRRDPEYGYAPSPGATADPGEIVWTWVPYEEDPSQGKDRPVLIVGRDGSSLLALMLTSRDRNNESSRHSGYIDIGSGPWDRKGRPSEVNLERIIRIQPNDVRRIGATLDRPTFDRVISNLDDAAGRQGR